MFHTRKLKPDRSIGGWILPIGAILILVLSLLFFGYAAMFIVLAGIFWVNALYSGYIFARMGNSSHLVVFLFQVFAGLMGFLAPDYISGQRFQEWRFAWVLGIVAFGVLISYLAFTKRIKWRGREIFELAAESVEETGNGYTPRPRPVGRLDFSKQEILAFARFCARHLIAVVYVSPRQVTFVPVKMGGEYTFMFMSGGAHQETTWISFDFDGDVSVHIAQKDYLDYIEPLAFDKLCESLGQLFIEFAETHRLGEGVRIIDRMDALRMSYFS
jgi:hypothetical protein